MNTTQTAIARLESGNTMPSTRTLRKIAKATGHRLRIIFEPEGSPLKPRFQKARLYNGGFRLFEGAGGEKRWLRPTV